MPIDWDETAPADTDIVSAYPANERAARDAVKDIFDIDHHSANDADQGKHDKVQLTDLAGDATIAAGQIGIWNDGGTLKGRVGTGAAAEFGKLPGVGFPTGTKLLFPQSSAPTGWTQDTDANDRVIRVIDNTGTGAATGGSWTISGVTVDGHTLTIAQLPTGVRSGRNISNIYSTADDASNALQAGSQVANVSAAGTAGSGSSHNHGLTADGAWRPAYLDVIKASKD